MKSEEALKYLKDFIDNEEPQIGAYNTTILKKAIDALEYRVPKKPNKYKCVAVDGRSYYEFICDECGCVLDETIDDFCTSCGQAIDWKDE